MLAYIGAGSNLGDRAGCLARAAGLLSEHQRVKVLRASRIYETEPWGYHDQPRFLNMILEVATDLVPLELLDVLQGIENALGRKRFVRWGPRTVDLDLLLYDGLAIDEDRLTIPHPRMWDRGFVLVPLAELIPDLMTPAGERLGDLVRRPEVSRGVVPYPAGCAIP
ncbi:MAG TPA: 2-amino-4-hydroxy-6-hydroxymethyldihydropteridine diphosphokinase [Firmicutes bacterium]|nr:2-amino-4-hydroxy-6-hydroxymethyldihydropteridine diphosphokinase [Bacillota bacterium]